MPNAPALFHLMNGSNPAAHLVLLPSVVGKIHDALKGSLCETLATGSTASRPGARHASKITRKFFRSLSALPLTKKPEP
jgi:hypothetical protein